MQSEDIRARRESMLDDGQLPNRAQFVGNPRRIAMALKPRVKMAESVLMTVVRLSGR
jgi:hypothetical protein